MSRKQRKKARDDWEQEKVILEEARQKHGRWCIPPEELDDFTKTVAEARQKYALPDAPAMPLQFLCLRASKADGDVLPAASQVGEHQDNINCTGFASEEFFAMVHVPVPANQIRKNETREKRWTKQQPNWTDDARGSMTPYKSTTLSETRHLLEAEQFISVM